MKNKPLIISGSSRKEGDTSRLTDLLFSNVEMTRIDLLDHLIEPYNYAGKYFEKDSFIKLFETILAHDKIIFVTPVYWYSMSGLMKIFFDRLTDIITIQKEIGRKLKGKRVFLASVGSDDLLPEGFEVPFRLTAQYLQMEFISTYYCKAINLENVPEDAVSFLDKINS